MACASGAGVGGVPHKFMYPKEDKENYQVMQFASQAAGSQGLATYVQQISEAAIKVWYWDCPMTALLTPHVQSSMRHQCLSMILSTSPKHGTVWV